MPSLERYGFRERLVHSVAGISYLYLLLTGLAFWTPALFWVAVVLGGGYLSRLLHPWVGFVFVGAVAWMYILWRRDMEITPGDRVWRRAIAAYVRNDEAGGAGRLNRHQPPPVSFGRVMRSRPRS